jgi:hypothetical protein
VCNAPQTDICRRVTLESFSRLSRWWLNSSIGSRSVDSVGGATPSMNDALQGNNVNDAVQGNNVDIS